MYDDYEVVYESNLNENFYLYLVLGIVFLVLLLIVLISMSRVFKKANRSGISAFIPVYNIYTLLEIANMTKAYLIPTLIPIVNIPFLLNINAKIAELFKKNKTFGIAMTFIPFIYYPILAFSGSEYVGINLSGMNNQIEDIPVIDENKNQEKEIQVNEEVKPTVSISTGVGKLGTTEKKDVDFNQLLKQQEKKEEPEIKKEINPNVGTTLKNADDIYSVSYIEQAPTNQIQAVNESLVNQPVVEPIPEVMQAQITDIIPNPINNPDMPVVQLDIPLASNPAVPEQVVEQQTQPEQPIPPMPQPATPIGKKVDLLASNTVVAGQDGYKLCPNCGTRVVDGAEICLICGSKLN